MPLENINLTGHFLIAMPAMTDSFFSKSVTFICTHNQDGAMGIMINRPTDITFETLFEKINVELLNIGVADKPVLYGGPVPVSYTHLDVYKRQLLMTVKYSNKVNPP